MHWQLEFLYEHTIDKDHSCHLPLPMRQSKLLWALAALLLISGPALVRCSEVEDAEEEDEYEDVLRASLIVRKYTPEPMVVAGRNVTVHLSLFNGGAA